MVTRTTKKSATNSSQKPVAKKSKKRATKSSKNSTEANRKRHLKKVLKGLDDLNNKLNDLREILRATGDELDTAIDQELHDITYKLREAISLVALALSPDEEI